MVGVDEVGRGCLAGPLLVVAARGTGHLPDGLADSKILSRGQRESFFDLLAGNCEFGEGWVKSVEINRLGLAGAMRLGIKRAISALRVTQDERIIMDGPVNYFPRKFKNVECHVDADALFPLVSAASIYAKVKRDAYMYALAKRHRRYGFETNVGYGTPEHLEALSKYGYLKTVHRRFFSPVYALDQAQLAFNTRPSQPLPDLVESLTTDPRV